MNSNDTSGADGLVITIQKQRKNRTTSREFSPVYRSKMIAVDTQDPLICHFHLRTRGPVFSPAYASAQCLLPRERHSLSSGPSLFVRYSHQKVRYIYIYLQSRYNNNNPHFAATDGRRRNVRRE